jgi:hypothetical protein
VAARVQGYTTTTAVFGGTKVVKIREWSCYSQPSDIYFEVRARLTTTRAQVQQIANGISDTIEKLLGAVAVTGVSWSQDVNAAGQVVGLFTVYWYSGDLDSSGWVEIPAGQFNLTHVAEAIIADSGISSF